MYIYISECTVVLSVYRDTSKKNGESVIIISAENSAPNITAAAVFSVLLGEESLYPLTVVDTGDNFTLDVVGGLPANSALESVGEGEFIFRWVLEELTTEPLVFVANDSRGAASTFVPIVEVCACANGGNCTRDGLLTANATLVLKCVCTEGESVGHYFSCEILHNL